MNNECGAPGHEHTHMCLMKRFSWSAVMAGALVGIGLSFLLNLFAVAIGLSLVTKSAEGMMTLAIGGFIGLIIATIASTFMAGFSAGFLGRPHCPNRNLGVLYGFTAWCAALILTALLAFSMTRYVSFYADFVSGPGAMSVSTDRPARADRMTPAERTSNAAAARAGTAPAAVATTGDAQQVANTLGYTSLLIFVLFLIGAISSCFGGHFGMTCDESRCGPYTNNNRR